MMRTIWAVVRDGKALPVEATELPEGARVLLTVLDDDEGDFWLRACQKSLDAIWDNAEDDVYAELLKECRCPRALSLLRPVGGKGPTRSCRQLPTRFPRRVRCPADQQD